MFDEIPPSPGYDAELATTYRRGKVLAFFVGLLLVIAAGLAFLVAKATS